MPKQNNYSFPDLVKNIQSNVIEQAEDIFEHFNAKPKFSITEIPNAYGGNPELHVDFSYSGRLYNGVQKTFVFKPTSQTEQGFVNEIRSYLLDCVDGFVNIGF